MTHTTNRLIEVLLKTLEPQIDAMVVDTVKRMEIKYGTTVSSFVKECIRLELTYDMIRSVECYTEQTDKLVELSAGRSNKGSLEITATIARDGKNYSFSTEVIYAGGYNIQQLHYRYITKTKLPKTGNAEDTNKLKNKIKALKKVDKLQKEFDMYASRVKAETDKLALTSIYTDEMITNEIKSESDWTNITWELIKKNGADANYNYKEENFNNWYKEMLDDSIERWKKTNIDWKKGYITSYIKSMEKLSAKIEQEKGITNKINIIKLF